MADDTVIGAGVAGLCAAYALSRAGLTPRLVDRAGPPGAHGCSWWAGGVLAPFCEGALSEPAIIAHGRQAAAFWAEVTQVHHRGSLVIALERFARRTSGYRPVSDVATLEPDLATHSRALFFEAEAHLDPRRALSDLVAALRPAFADNMARVLVRGRALHLNGLFRDGYLMAPALAHQAADWLTTGKKGDLGHEDSSERRTA